MGAGHDAIISRHSLPPAYSSPLYRPAAPAARDRIVALVESLLAMNKALAGDLPPKKRSRLEATCEEADREIDRIVYELYVLAAEEIAVVEGVNT